MSTLSEPIGLQDHTVGPVNARITLVEYGDFECPNCAAAAPVIRELLRELKDEVRFVFRHYPIVITHREAHLAAQVSEAAAAQGKFWEMHNLLFERQASLSRESLLGYSRELGLDVARIAGELDRGAHIARVDHDLETGDDSAVRWTPTFYLNGSRLGPLPDPHELIGIVRST
jgi:protein-disulfide isomerase